MKLLIASNNVHKLREFRDMFKSLNNFDLYSLLDFPDYIPPEETGGTFFENAQIKAVHAAKELNLWAVADDSGLVVPALNGRPGVYTKRYAGPDATDKEKREKLLDEMRNLKDIQRSAYFECVLSLASPDGPYKSVSGRVEGVIADEERGNKGFAYDSLFIKHDYDKTFAEIDEATKNRISHRRKALDKMLMVLENLG